MNGYRKSLRTVGSVLLIVGLLDIVAMTCCVATGTNYVSGLNMFAVIAGVLLRRGSLRTARVVWFLSGFLLSGLIGLLLVVPFVVPFDLLLTYLGLHSFAVGGWAVLVSCLAIILALVYRGLTAPPVLAAMDERHVDRKRYWRKPWAGFVVGGLLVLVATVCVSFVMRGETAERARIEAQRQTGVGYKFLVSSLNWDWDLSFGRTTVSATVIAYNPRQIRTVEVTWEE